MCRFKVNKSRTRAWFIFHFNTSYVSVQVDTDLTTPNAIKFQYILCVGSSDLDLLELDIFLKFQYILCVGSSSSQSLLLYLLYLFQYILCVGSSG